MLKTVRWPGVPVHQGSMLLLKFEESSDLHWIFLDGAGSAHWNDMTEEQVLESLDDDGVVEVMDLGEAWRAPIAAVVIASTREWVEEIRISLQNGAQLQLAYLGEDCFTCGTALTLDTGPHENPPPEAL